MTIEERAARHRLIARDTVALSTLLAIIVALTFSTYLLFHSFSSNRLRLETRWKARGEAALAHHQPVPAIDDLSSALAYAPDDRTLQIELATALAAAGRTKEAVVYFDTLHEAQPGDGMINLQLARLSVTQGMVPSAVDQYQAALDGTWYGDGFLRRREVRLELSRYLIAQHRYDEARNQLLIAAGNAADNHALQLTVGGLLEQADGEADAYNIYRKAMAFSDTRTAALAGAGRTAAALNRYLLARNLLEQASGQADFGRLPEDERTAAHGLLGEAIAILDVFPSASLSLHARATRVAHLVQVVRAQVQACSQMPASGGIALAPPASGADQVPTQARPAVPPTPERTQAGTASSLDPAGGKAGPGRAAEPAGALRTAIDAVQRAGSTIAGAAAPKSPPAPLPPAPTQASADAEAQALSDRWRQLPPDATLERRMERDPALLESTLQLVYEMERETTQGASSTIGHGVDRPAGEVLTGCIPPTRDVALLIKIVSAPDEIERQ